MDFTQTQQQTKSEQEKDKYEGEEDMSVQTYPLHSIKSNLFIRQIPSQGISFKLWPAASTLVSLFHNHNNTSLFHSPNPLRILELGSGTGIVGMAAASLLGARVTITDLFHAIPNLEYNVEANLKTIGINGGNVEVAPLAWGDEEEMKVIQDKGEYDIVIGSDLVYHHHLYEPLLKTLRFFLLAHPERVFVMAHSKRWKKESGFFKKANKDFHVKVIHRDDPCDGERVGILVCTFVAKNKKKIDVSE